MIQFNAKIIKNLKICDNFFELTLKPENSITPEPGQFTTIRVNSDTSPLLRRPFAYSDFDLLTGNFSIIYQMRGKATEILSKKLPDENLDCIGPLGNQFPLPPNNSSAILVAGGIGVGPIQYLASELKYRKIPYILIFGSKNKNSIPRSSIFTKLNPVICTDDGSLGFKGTTADYLNTSMIPKNSVIYCCGPHPMLKACNKIAIENNCTCWISVEQVMACGVGACMGCVIKVRTEQKFARACKEGPVFNGNEIDWDVL